MVDPRMLSMLLALIDLGAKKEGLPKNPLEMGGGGGPGPPIIPPTATGGLSFSGGGGPQYPALPKTSQGPGGRTNPHSLNRFAGDSGGMLAPPGQGRMENITGQLGIAPLPWEDVLFKLMFKSLLGHGPNLITNPGQRSKYLKPSTRYPGQQN